MKKTILNFGLALALVLTAGSALSSCGFDPEKALEKEVDDARKTMTKSMEFEEGIRIDDIYLDKEDKEVVCIVVPEDGQVVANINKAPALFKQLILASFDTEDKDIKQLTELLEKAGYNMRYEVTFSGASPTSITIGSSELQERINENLTSREKDERLYKLGLDLENINTSDDYEDGLKFQEVRDKPHYVEFEYLVDENMYDMSLLMRTLPLGKTEALNEFRKSDRDFFDLLVRMNKGIRMVYKGDRSGREAVCYITAEEVKKSSESTAVRTLSGLKL